MRPPWRRWLPAAVACIVLSNAATQRIGGEKMQAQVMEAKTAATAQSGYVISGWGSLSISGWRKSL